MVQALTQNLNYDRPIKLADEVYWVGFSDPGRGLHCNPYLIVDGDEGVLIDGGSRPEFSIVMMKIMQTGLAPSKISTLIYDHYDPDLCGSIVNLEDIIDRPDLRIVSKRENNVFIRYYGVRSRLLCIDDLGCTLTLASGRVLRFILTPYAHSPGSFMTFDEKTGILFTGDLFGSFEPDRNWQLFRELPAECLSCERASLSLPGQQCETIHAPCAIPPLLEFHREEMTSNRALRLACKKILGANPKMVAPQHGSIWYRRSDIEYIAERLAALVDVGIDRVPDAP